MVFSGFSYFISVFNDYQIPVLKLIVLSLMEWPLPPHGEPYHVCLIAAPTWDGGTSISSICYHHVRIVSLDQDPAVFVNHECY